MTTNNRSYTVSPSPLTEQMELHMLDAPADQVLTIIAVGIIMAVSAGILIVRDLPAFRRLIDEA